MDTLIWFTVAIGMIILILGLAFWFCKKDKKYDPDYYAFFIIGLVWMPFGLITGNSAFWIMGMVFMVIGLTNKNKWKERKRHKFLEMNKKERIAYIIVMIILGLVLLSGVIFFLFK